MIEQSRLLDLQRSKVRVDLILNYQGNCKARITVLEFKHKFFVWEDPYTVGVWGSPFWQSTFDDVDKAINTPHALEREFSYFLKSSEALSAQTISTTSCGEITVESKCSNRFGAWAFDNVHLDAWVFNEREVFLLKMHLEDEKGKPLTEPKDNAAFRLGASEQCELWLALREISDEVAKIINSFHDKQVYPPCNATDPVNLPEPFGPNSALFEKQLNDDLEEMAQSRAKRRIASYLHDHPLDEDCIDLLCEIIHDQEQAFLREKKEKLGLKTSSNRSDTLKGTLKREEKQKANNPTRSAGRKPKKAPVVNEAIRSASAPWPVRPGNQSD